MNPGQQCAFAGMTINVAGAVLTLRRWSRLRTRHARLHDRREQGCQKGRQGKCAARAVDEGLMEQHGLAFRFITGKNS